MRYLIVHDDAGPQATSWQETIISGLADTLERRGHTRNEGASFPQLVLHPVSWEAPRPFRRQSRATFVVAVAEAPEGTEPLTVGYPVLIRSISNLLIFGGLDSRGRPWAYLITPELGCYRLPPDANQDQWFANLYERLAPLAESRLVIDNLFDEDLPDEIANGTNVTREMTWASRVLAEWDLFPTPFPVSDLLPPRDYRHLQKLFSIGGLSYGNLSARHDQEHFWMTASGVDKGKIGTVSQDILLVKGFDPEANAMRISVRPGSFPHRVSVDAIEHWGIYRTHPTIGAMVHVHAWVDDIPTTSINYPCGTVEMGQAMSELLDRDPNPGRTIVGLKNHGITATGPDFRDILSRLEGKVRAQVPMA